LESFNRINLFNDTDFFKIQEFVLNHIKHSNNFNYASAYGRYWNLVEFPEDIEELIINTARSEFKKDIDIVYTQCVKYQIKDGVIPSLGEHKDKFFCTHTMNLIIDSTVDWPLIVEGSVFSNPTNSAVFLKGDSETHWRPEYPSKNENDYLIAVFINFSTIGGEMTGLSKEFSNISKSMRDAMFNGGGPSGYLGSKGKIN